jgi:hypothetical protein
LKLYKKTFVGTVVFQTYNLWFHKRAFHQLSHAGSPPNQLIYLTFFLLAYDSFFVAVQQSLDQFFTPLPHTHSKYPTISGNHSTKSTLHFASWYFHFLQIINVKTFIQIWLKKVFAFLQKYLFSTILGRTYNYHNNHNNQHDHTKYYHQLTILNIITIITVLAK